jgi:hypothetical protein
MLSARIGVAGLAVAVGLTGCSDGTGPSGGQQVTLSVVAGVGSPAAAASGADSVTLGGHTLVFDQVQLVLREIELKRVEVGDCDDDGDDNSGPGSAPAAGHDDGDCEEFAIGPMLLDLPLTGQPERIITVQVDTGTFREVEFEIHKPDDDDAGDVAFLRDHPEFRRVSILARGRFDGQTFAFLTDLNVEQEHRLVPPLVVTERTGTNLTLVVDLAGWFALGGELVNPLLALKGQPFEDQVENNIKRSLRLFEDRDRDGDDDDEDDD